MSAYGWPSCENDDDHVCDQWCFTRHPAVANLNARVKHLQSQLSATPPAAPEVTDPPSDGAGEFRLCAEDRFHLWAKLFGIQQEAKSGQFGTPGQHITLDHIYEEVTTALSYFDGPVPEMDSPTPEATDDEVPIPKDADERAALARAAWLTDDEEAALNRWVADQAIENAARKRRGLEETSDFPLAAARPAPSTPADTGAGLIAAERQRQIDTEGWTPEHDDDHGGGDLAMAAAAYAIHDANGCPLSARGYALWPFDPNEWKPHGQVANLVRAGALIAAEIDRLLRAAAEVTR